MRKKYPYLFAVLFIACAFFVLSGTHVFGERVYVPTFGGARIEHLLPKYNQIVHAVSLFLYQFAP